MAVEPNNTINSIIHVFDHKIKKQDSSPPGFCSFSGECTKPIQVVYDTAVNKNEIRGK